MITIELDTSSGVPFTGRPKKSRPITSATTRKQSRNASVAAATSIPLVIQSLTRASMARLPGHPACGAGGVTAGST